MPIPHPARALLGGVFDPVHVGHIQLGKAALQTLPTDTVLFMPAGSPPHKNQPNLTAVHHRVAMLEIALSSEPGLELDRREVDGPWPTYTVDTLLDMRREDPHGEIYFLIGADNIATLGSWHRAAEILELCTPVVVCRPGHQNEFTPASLPFLAPERLAAINALRIETPPCAASSSEIRAAIGAGQVPQAWLPPGVWDYIVSYGLYGSQDAQRP